MLQSHPEIKLVEVQGHTDSRGSDESNQALSDRRAKSVRRFLEKKGIAPERLRSRGYGESEPIETNETRSGRAANRRVEFNIVGGSDTVQEGDTRQLEVD